MEQPPKQPPDDHVRAHAQERDTMDVERPTDGTEDQAVFDRGVLGNRLRVLKPRDALSYPSIPCGELVPCCG